MTAGGDCHQDARSIGRAKKENLILKLVFLCFILMNPLSAGIGFKAGIGLTGLHSSTGDFRHVLGYEMNWLTMGNLIGFQAGFFKTFKLTNRFEIQPELFYTLRGGDASRTFIYDDVVYKIKISYAELPLLLKCRLLTKRAFTPVVFAGPYAALKLKAKKQTVIWKTKEETSLDNVTRIDYGFLLGLGGEYDLGSGRVFLELRSSLGLKNMMTVPSGTIRLYDEKDSIRNFNFSVLIGYGF